MITRLLICTLVAFSALANAQEPEVLSELLPGLFIGDGIVEFDGAVAIDCHHPDTPDVFLEMLVTAPDSREHEALVVAKIKPSLLHAALLAAGLEPGSPMKKNADGQTIKANGDGVRVLVAVGQREEKSEFVPIETWVVQVENDEDETDKKTLDEQSVWSGLVFAGSILNAHGYAADRGGTLISLTSFGNEVIAPSWTTSHQAEIDEPIWIANRELVPERDAGVRIRIEMIKEDKAEVDAEDTDKPDSHQPDGIDINGDL